MGDRYDSSIYGKSMKFTIEITEEAIEDLEYFDKATRVTILDAVER